MVDVDQIGDLNTAVANATKSGNSYFSDDNDITIYQEGNGNRMEARVKGGDNNDIDANHFGNGNLNRVGVNGDNNDVDIDTDGDQNKGDW